MESAQPELFFDPRKRELSDSAALFVNRLLFVRVHFGFKGGYRCRFRAMRENSSSRCVLWTAMVAIHARAAISTGGLIESVLTTMR